MNFDPEIIRYSALAVLAAGALWAAGYWAGKRAAAPAGVAARPSRRRPIIRAVLLSLLVHAALGVVFSLYIVSEAVYQAVRIPERQEVKLQADTLARERLALGIREASPVLPPLPAPAAVPAPPEERLPLPEIAPRETAAPIAAPFAGWEPAASPAPPSDDRFRPEPLIAAAAPVYAPALPEIRLEEPEPVSLAEAQAPTDEPLPSPPLPAIVASPPSEPLPPLIASTPAPPPAEISPATSVAAAMRPEAPALDLPELPELSGLLEPALALETRPEPAERFLLRDRETRERVMEELGGSPETEAAIERALRWLARHQEDDGRWKIDRFGGKSGHDVAATSLAALAFLAWGTDPAGGGEFSDATRRALDWLVARAGEDGDLRHEQGRPSGDMYDQGMAGIALAEALALTGDSRFREPARRAINFIVAAQNPGDGGWRYRPGDGGDTSVFGWQIMALTSARMAGIDVAGEVFGKARGWLERVGGGKHGGEYGYQNRHASPAMVAEGMFSLQLLGRENGAPARDDPTMRESADYLARHLPQGNQRDFYYWYYGALALHQHGGPVWEKWNGQLKPILLESQREDGSWDPTSRWGSQAGRAVVTALAALTLEVYYRYLPLYDGR